jgi:hypothetical protein
MRHSSKSPQGTPVTEARRSVPRSARTTVSRCRWGWTPFLLIAFLSLVFVEVRAGKTRLESETYVENSEVDFKLEAEDITTPRQSRTMRVYKLSAPELQPGEHDVLQFVDGRFFRREKIHVPGRLTVSIRGLAPGSHRLVIQVVDGAGRVGSVIRNIEVVGKRN